MPLDTSGSDGNIAKVLQGGFCVGCGACAAIPGSPMTIKMNKYGMYTALYKNGEHSGFQMDLSKVCPFGNDEENENTIGQRLFSSTCKHDERIGYYLKVYAGFVKEDEFRTFGTSGGITTWLLTEMLTRGYINGVIHVRPCLESTSSDRVLFKYAVSETVEDVRKGTKSRYYPIEMSKALCKIRDHPGKFAFVGVPCFVKAVRLLSAADKAFEEKFSFSISLFCGHLKSAKYVDYLIRKVGIDPENVVYVDFRRKLATSASDYAIEIVEKRNNEEIKHTKPMREVVEDPWGSGIFKYSACDYCDDVAGETADISLGDAWLPRYVKDPLGTNIVIVRNPKVLEILEEGKINGKLHLEELSPQDVVASQEGNFRHRQDELTYRLFLKEKSGEWYPKKRVVPTENAITKKRQRIQQFRIKLAKTSHEAYLMAESQNDIKIFESVMGPIIRKYRRVYSGNLLTRAVRKVKRVFNRKGDKS